MGPWCPFFIAMFYRPSLIILCYNGLMRITSWNVNGIRAAENKGLIEFLAKDNADILCIQETKAQPEQLTESLLAPQGYHSYWSSAEKKGYSGTAFYSKTPLEVSKMDVKEFDAEGRVIIADIKSKKKTYTLINAYFPNSQAKGARLDYKIAFCDAMLKLCSKISNPLIVCGDYNIAHKEIDLARPKENVENPGFLPEERAWMTQFLEAGNIDTFREFNQEPHQYTWWSYRGGARSRNVGWRIDYFCTNKLAAKLIKNCNIRADIMGSDHCPLTVEIE